MTAQMNVTTERVDDIPLLLAHSDKMGVPELLDHYFKPHGNWEGMSLGWTTAMWLTHILDALSLEQKWQQFETALNRQLIRVYDLKPKRVRVDSTTASGYWTVTQEGLFQLGYEPRPPSRLAATQA